jgi:broad specificity phosphatase PhoE
MVQTLVILVRHGQTEWNRVERFRGWADVPLNDNGLKQAEKTAARIANQWQPVAIFSSPLSRAIKTAEAIGKATGLPVNPESGLKDINYGKWQGLTPEEAGKEYPEMVEAWYLTPHLAKIPGGETLDELRARAMKTVEELASKYRGKTIILVGHTVINRIILLGVMGLGNDRFWRIKQEPCAINVFEIDAGEYTLISLNDTCHLT